MFHHQQNGEFVPALLHIELSSEDYILLINGSRELVVSLGGRKYTLNSYQQVDNKNYGDFLTDTEGFPN